MNVQDHEYEYRIKNTISVVKCNNFRSIHHCVCRYVVTGTLSLINCQMHLQYMYRVIKTVLKVLRVISNDLHTVYSILVYSHHRIVSKLIRVGKNHDFFYLNRIFFNFFFYNS